MDGLLGVGLHWSPVPGEDVENIRMSLPQYEAIMCILCRSQVSY